MQSPVCHFQMKALLPLCIDLSADVSINYVCEFAKTSIHGPLCTVTNIEGVLSQVKCIYEHS